jgi:hypothetical protein
MKIEITSYTKTRRGDGISVRTSSIELVNKQTHSLLASIASALTCDESVLKETSPNETLADIRTELDNLIGANSLFRFRRLPDMHVVRSDHPVTDLSRYRQNRQCHLD